MADMTKIGAELSSAAAIVPPERAAAVAREVYGLSGTVEWLWGEKDSNYRLVTPGGREFLLKILTPGEDAGVTGMHSRALAHLAARDPELPVQRVIRTRQGELDARMGDGRGVRLVTFLSGTAQAAGPVTDAQRHAVGVLLRRTPGTPRLTGSTNQLSGTPERYAVISLSPLISRHAGPRVA